MSVEISTYLKYVNLQLAAESLFGISLGASPGQVSTTINDTTLALGNNRSSRFTDAEATQFVNDWTVVEHKSNTSTGFSGTLFRATRTDDARGITAGELVLSFRSTEFADDSARDNQATNTLEVKDKGWAFGQIADMEKWYADLQASGKIGTDDRLSVTGYSLGGHLATAFNLLHQTDRVAMGISKIAATYLDALAGEQATLERAQHDLGGANQQLAKLQTTVPLYQQTATAFEQMAKDGFASAQTASDKLREKVEKEQDLKSQQAAIGALTAVIDQSRQKLAQIKSAYESQLRNERIELLGQQQRNQGELDKQAYRSGLLELKASEDGTIKDLATYSPGTVVQPGAVLLNLVPKNEPLFAEVSMHNEDVGFVAPGQVARVKLQAYPFQKYGLMEGTVHLVSADSSANDPQKAAAQGQSPQSYKVLVKLASQVLRASNGEMLKLSPGMVVQAEIHQGRRTVLEYLLSPVQQVAQEAGRER